MKYCLNKTKGFTLVELVISVGIFSLMTALMIAKYGTFNQGILLTNLAYDVALTIRNAQSYGLNVKSTERDDNNFQTPFGVHFSSELNQNTVFTFFADTGTLGIFSGDTPNVNTNIKGGAKVKSLCVGYGSCSSGNVDNLDVTFRRPDPNAIINGVDYSYAEIVLESSDGSQRKVIVRSTGQIAVAN